MSIHSLFGAYPRLSEALASGSIEFNGIRYKQLRGETWYMLGFEGEEDSIERKLKEEM